MRYKVIFLLLFPLMADLVVACCNCLEPVTYRYTNKSISVNHLDNSGQYPAESSGASVFKTAYGIRIKLSREKTACILSPHSLFMSSAWAYSCRCPRDEWIPKDSIVAINIFTLQDFNSSHAAGADISAYFKVYDPYVFSTIDHYLENTSALLYDETQLQTNINVLLMTAPALNTRHQFRVQITLSDGRILEQNTTPIDLL